MYNNNAYRETAISPSNETYMICGEVHKFCKEHDLGVSRVVDCYKFNKPHFKGWQFKII